MMKRRLLSLYAAVTRTKTVNTDTLHEGGLKRCLNVMDLTALGVGNTLGSGIYVIIGQVARDIAGPSTLLCILIAAIASMFSALCYAELASRVPSAGSAYAYSYIGAGEIIAYVIGWNMILEGVIGAAVAAKTWSQYLDYLFNGTISTSIIENVGEMHGPGMSEYPDFVALALTVGMTLILAVGVKMSTVVNASLTVLNMLVILLIVVVGLYFADIKNWTDPPGFFPMGVKGIISGAATCFYGFVGFDAIASSGEEANNPTKSIPVAIGATLAVVSISYLAVSIVITLMVPWYDLPGHAVMPNLFGQFNIKGVNYIITFGGLCGMIASLMGSLYPMPRTIYAMAQDGLLYKFMGYVNSRSKTPMIGLAVVATLAGLLVLLLDLQSLVEMFSIGTLMAYTLVAVCVVLLRYKTEHIGMSYEKYQELLGNVPLEDSSQSEDGNTLGNGRAIKTVDPIPSTETTVVRRIESTGQSVVCEEKTFIRERIISTDRTKKDLPHVYSLGNLFNVGDEAAPDPTVRTSKVVSLSLLVIMIFAIILCSLAVYCQSALLQLEWWSVLLVCIVVLVVLSFSIFIARQPQNTTRLVFSCPCVPVVPIVSVITNLYLMMSLSYLTWIRFAVWMTIGFIIYFTYGIKHSKAISIYEHEKTIINYGAIDDSSVVPGEPMLDERDEKPPPYSD